MTDIAQKTSQFVKPAETPNDDSKKREPDVALYGRLPTEADDDPRDILGSKLSNSDNDDSVFQMPIDPPRLESPKTPKTPKVMTPKLNCKEQRTFFQVINENVPL